MPEAIAIDGQYITVNGSSVYLTPSQAVIMRVLVRSMPLYATIDRLMYAIWAGQDLDEPENGRNVLSVQVCRLRQLIEPLGLYIETVWGRGFKLSHDSDRSVNPKLSETNRLNVRRRFQ